MPTLNTENEYNKLPVFYCKYCLSLNIRNINDDEDLDYCDTCGATEIEKCQIEEWESLYETRYGHKYVVKNNKTNKYIQWKS